MFSLSITNDAIKEIFREEVGVRSGDVKNGFDNQDLLLMRGLLPQVEQVAFEDELRNGVALEAREGLISVYSFLERIICRNGMILRMAVGQRIVDREMNEASWADYQIREAIDACSQPSAFVGHVLSIRRAMHRPINRVHNMMGFLGSNVAGMRETIAERVSDRLHDEDPSEFGLMNAITSVARDTSDHSMRWNLEEFGGRIGLGLVKIPERAELSSLRRNMNGGFRREPV